MKDQSSPTDLCPFCGKPFKRLKSHLPYCKMADSKNKSPALANAHKDNQMAVKSMNAVLPGEVIVGYLKEKGKRKTDITEHIGRPKKQLQKNCTISSSQISLAKMAKPSSDSRVPYVSQHKDIQNTKGQRSKKHENNNNLDKPNYNDKYILAEDISAKHSYLEHSPKKLTAPILSGTNEVVTSLMEQDQAAVPEIVPSAAVLQSISARPDTDRKVAAISETVSVNSSGKKFNVLCQQVFNDTLERTENKYARLPVQDQFSVKTGYNTQEGVANDSIALWDQVQSSLNGKHLHEQVSLVLQQESEPSSPTKSSQVSTFVLSSTIDQESVTTQLLPGIHHTLHSQNTHKVALCNIKKLETIQKSTEINLDLLFPHKIVSLLDVEPGIDTLGLQWMPHLYSNYVRQRIAPGRQDQWGLDQRLSKTKEPTEVKPELCKPVPDSLLASRYLMDVRLGELPSWLAGRRFTMKMFPELVQNAWGRYNNKYINVRKGGVAGLAMLLAGYCVLSYAWNFNHIKQDRWRKYH